MNSSLKKLDDILPRDRFGIIGSVFPNLSSTELKLLQQKGYYPYPYVSGREKFSEKSLPPLNEWRNTLKGNAVTIAQENLIHAKTMWNNLKCRTLQQQASQPSSTNWTFRYAHGARRHQSVRKSQ